MEGVWRSLAVLLLVASFGPYRPVSAGASFPINSFLNMSAKVSATCKHGECRGAPVSGGADSRQAGIWAGLSVTESPTRLSPTYFPAFHPSHYALSTWPRI